MNINELQIKIESLYDKESHHDGDLLVFDVFKTLLNEGNIRAAELCDDVWTVNTWVKKGILLGFKMGKLDYVDYSDWGFIDKDTFIPRRFNLADKVRVVPGGSSVRDTAYVGKNVTIMPPSFINAGAYIDDRSMIDSHALVGSCAQVGKNVHLSAGSMLGGVLEPINANPVIIEDDVFIGGNCGIYEGVIVKRNAVISAGVIITNSTPVFDCINGDFLKRNKDKPLIIPQNAVVIPGSRTHKEYPDVSIYCPVIIKYRDDKTDNAVKLEEFLR
jgi:2,3,4,5-tetrahydropyridine-2-carboxylate N-succinyltransferase